MADEPTTPNLSAQDSGNTLNDLLNSRSNYSELTRAVSNGVTQALDNYDRQNNPRNMSQSLFRDRQNEMEFGPNSRRKKNQNYKRTGNILDDFEQGIKDQMLDSLKRSEFGKGIQGALSEFTKQFGFEFKDLPHEFGKHIGQKLFKNLSNSEFGQDIVRRIGGLANRYIDGHFGQGTYSNIANLIKSKGQEAAGQAASNTLSTGVSSTVGGAASSLPAGQAGVTAGGGQAGVQAANGSLAGIDKAKLMNGMESMTKSAGAVAIIAYVAYKLIKPLLTGIGDVIKAWGGALNREEDIRKKRLENAQTRLEQDIKSMAQLPFTILEEAAKKWEDTWDQNLSKIVLTQGYNKENTYALYSSIAERLNKEALGNVIPATDVVNNLSQILDSGLSGKIAEEFAYQATKLNAEIPTENFIGYAATYAQIAAQQINAGKSQQEALDYATKQLQLFASNLLYSSRTLAGGFTTGLKDASSLFQSATEIVQTAKSGDVASVSGTLTSISAMVGSIAPDLASGLVNNVVQAAIGGNNDSIVALRSLAGINASNTEFLKKLAEDPQGLFVSIFQGLGNMQNMAPGAYMEVAEGISSVFGVDMKALARVDFNNLANQIANMQVNDSSLRENVALLVSEQATTSAAQARYEEINQQILNDGLAYVIDSEYGRMIQEHMWEEQLANEIKSTEYSVNLQGAALSLLEGLRHAVANILNFLNPIGFLVNKITDLAATRTEAATNQENIAKLLEANKVGGGNYTAFNNLTTRGTDLGLTTSIKKRMGTDNSAMWNAANNLKKIVGGVTAGLTNPAMLAIGSAIANNGGEFMTTGTDWNNAVDKIGGLSAGIGANVSKTATKATSTYGWGGTVGKSALSLTSGSSSTLPASVRNTVSATQANANAISESNRHLQNMLDTVEKSAMSVKQGGKGMSYDMWKATAGQYGISDFSEAIKTYGKSEEEIRAYFEANQARSGAIEEQARKDDEQAFRDETRKFWDFSTGVNGIFNTALWNPFITDYFRPFFDQDARFDQRMNAIDEALVNIQLKEDELISQIGDNKQYTVIGALTDIHSLLTDAFVTSPYQDCLEGWNNYFAAKEIYQSDLTGKNIKAWSDVNKANGDKQNEASLALANALTEFTASQLKEMDPQMQANVLLGKIVVILEAIMQQNNKQAGGLSLIDTISALGLGATKKT